MKKIITSLILLFGVLSTLFAANVTLYYVNSTKWTKVNGYVWNFTTGEELATWSGTTMTKTSETAKGFDVYSITFDAAKYDRIIFNGSGQTADLSFSTSKPYYYEGAWYATLAEINGADAPAELTLYYVNTTKWSKVFAYAWIEGANPIAVWPGAAATLAGRTKDGIEVYSYTFNPTMANQIIFNNGNGSQTKDLPINAATPYFYNNNWVASFAYDPLPVEPTPVLDPIYLRGNVNAWGIDDTWKLTTTDGNYFVANYAAGSEVELSGSFKLASGTTDWAPHNFGADIEVEAGKSYVLTAGSNSPNINTSGKIKVSKIEFTLSTKTLKITGQTVADKFDITTDQGIALVENLDGTLQYIPLEFQANGVYTGVYTFAKSAKSMPLFKVGGTADLNTIDFGDNGTSIIRLDQLYTLKRGSSNFVAINQTDLGSQGVDNGTKFDVTVTFTEDWGVTLLLIAQKKPIDPEQPKVVISDLTAATFAETTVNETADATATFTIENATQAEAVIVEDEAGVFSVATPVIDGTAGSVVVTFAPTAAGTYTATLTITAAGVSQSVAIAATAVEAVTPVDLSYVVAGNGSENWLNGIEWDPQSAANAMTDADSDGIYEITYSQVPAGTYAFKVVANTGTVANWLGYGSLDTDNSSNNIPVVGSGENIGFTLNQTANVTIQFNTLTGKIILTTPSGSFGTVKIEYFHVGDKCLPEFQFTAENGNKVVFQQPAFENTDGTFAVSCGIIGNCNYAVYEKHLYTLVAQGGNYTVTVQFNGDYDNPEFTISAELIEVPTITSFSILSYGYCDKYTFSDANNNTVIISQDVQLEAGETYKELAFELVGNCDATAYYDVLRTTVSESGVYDVTIQFNGDYENPSFSIAATKGAMYLMGGFNNWAPANEYKLTTVDGNYFAIEYAQGQEVELSGGFKIASADWGVYDYGKSADMGNVEAGVEYTLKLYGDNLTIADKILVSKVEFTLSTGSFLITGVAQENKFDTTTDQGIALVEFNAGVQTYNVLDFTADGVYTGTYTYSGDNVSFKVGGATDLNTMDYGYNGSEIVIDEAYIMQRFAYNNVALAADTDVLPGDVFNVTVTVTEDWGVTLLLTVKSQVPRPAISNLYVQPCGEVTVGKQGIIYATFNVENITEVSAVITGQGAQAFTVGTPVIVDAMMGYVQITFTPEQAGTYTVMLTISSGKAAESVEITATAVSDTPTAIQDAKALGIYATNGTVYAEGEFTIYTLAGLNVTQQNGALEGVYIVSTDKGNAMISVW